MRECEGSTGAGKSSYLLLHLHLGRIKFKNIFIAGKATLENWRIYLEPLKLYRSWLLNSCCASAPPVTFQLVKCPKWPAEIQEGLGNLARCFGSRMWGQERQNCVFKIIEKST